MFPHLCCVSLLQWDEWGYPPSTSNTDFRAQDLTADVFLTSVVGAVVSILATIIPRCFCCMKPLANRCWVSQNSLDCAEKIGSVWQESVELAAQRGPHCTWPKEPLDLQSPPCTLRYMLGSKAHAKKFQLQRKALPSVICVDDHLDPR